MKILFFNPPTTTSLEMTKDGQQYVRENLGKMYFALPKAPFDVMAKLKNIKDVKKEIILLNFEWYKNKKLKNKDLHKIILNKKPDIILTTCCAQACVDTTDYLCTQLKEKAPHIPIIIGGQAVDLLKEKFFKFCPNCDFVVLGSADKSLPKVIEHLISKKQDLKKIPDIIYRHKDKIIKTKHTDSVNFQTHHYENVYKPYSKLIKNLVKFKASDTGVVTGADEFSKGCLFNCSFCAAKKKFVKRDINKVIKNIEYLYSLGIHKFYFHDLTFGLDITQRKEVLDTLIDFKQKNPNFSFKCITRANLITQEFVDELLKSGCYEISLGVECNDEAVLALMNKRISENTNIKSLDILGKSKLLTRLFLIEGFPGSSSNSTRNTFKLLNYMENQNYNYFSQVALNRDIIPTQDRFIEKEKNQILKRGNLAQLDFRTDGRYFGWDQNRAIRSIASIYIAYPTTDIGIDNRDTKLQQRLLLNTPFVKDKIDINDLVDYTLNSKIKDIELLELRIDLIHLLDGVFTENEICEMLGLLHKKFNEKFIKKEVNSYIKELRNQGLIDSFGNPNLIEPKFKSKSNHIMCLPQRNKGLFLFWNGADMKYMYMPKYEKIDKIKNQLHHKVDDLLFFFLIFSKGIYSIRDISTKLSLLFDELTYFKDPISSFNITQNIYNSCKQYGFSK